MPNTSYEIRLCLSCGLRYPILTGHNHGTRCPACAGETRLVLNRDLSLETKHQHPGTVSNKNTSRFSVLLDNVRSAWNVGSILRSADGFGFKHAYLCGITPTPENPAVTKTSLGAENNVPWSYHKDAVKLGKELKKKGYSITALEEEEGSLTLSNASKVTDGIIIVGNENMGVDPELLELCERIVHIPMRGGKKSFNVATAFSIAAYDLTNR